MSEINPFTAEDLDLDESITSAFNHLSTLKPDEDGYLKTVDSLTKLYALRNTSLQHYSDAEAADAKHYLDDSAQTFEQMQEGRPFYERVDPNTLLTVLGNVFIGLAVIKYEQTGVISSKVMSFMKKI